MKNIALWALISATILIQTASAAKMSFVSPTDTMIAWCPNPVDIMLDTNGVETTAIDVRIIQEDNFVINDFNGEWWLFRSYTIPRLTTIAWWPLVGKKTIYILGSTFSRQGIKNKGKVWTVMVTPDKNTQRVNLNFYMIPNIDTDDSNVAVFGPDGVYDALTNVENKSFTVVSWTCAIDTPFSVVGEAEKVTLKDNSQFVPERPREELIDNIMAWIVYNFRYIVATVITIATIIFSVKRFKKQ